MPGHVVVCVGDSCVCSSVVQTPYAGQLGRSREGGDGCILKPSLVDAFFHVIMIYG